MKNAPDMGGIGVSQGEVWKANRKLAVSHILSKHHLKDAEWILIDESKDVAESLAGAIEKIGGSVSIDPSPALRAASLNMTTAVSFGRRFYNFSPDFFLEEAEAEEADNFTYADFASREGFPWPVTEQSLSNFVKYQESIGFLRGMLQEILEEHKAEGDERGMEGAQVSFVDHIIHAQEHQELDSGDISAVSLMLDLMLAGSDSVSKSLSFSVYLLTQHADIQEELYKELRYLQQFSLAALDSLPLLEAVILETLRLYPVAPLGLPHVCTATDSIGRFTIKKDTVVVPNIWALHRDPKVWPAPAEFRPHRFMSDKTLKTHLNFAPFGLGARNCVGKYLGLAQMKSILARLFHQFEFRPASQHFEIYDVMGLTLSPRSLKCTISQRQSSTPR